MSNCHIPYPCTDAHIVLGRDIGIEQKWLRIYIGKWGIVIPIDNDRFRILVDQIREENGSESNKGKER